MENGSEEKENLQKPFVNSEVLLTLKPYYGLIPVDHPDTLSPYPCLQCRRRCNTIEELELHRRWHRREYECSICDKTFTTFEIFKSHVRKHYVDATKDFSVNNKIRETPVTCKYCEEKFSTLRDLHQHTSLYSDDYTRCEQCDQFLPACHVHLVGVDALEVGEEMMKRYNLNKLREETYLETSCVLDGIPKIHSSVSTYNHHVRKEPSYRPFNVTFVKQGSGTENRWNNI
ncbi:zinc finger protein 28-like [Bolinopsis microptera]|uniref:zinc finger protein 28-like n=1 Tax=Bolinopsis microptera TaxID=2820187 RepID=UPI00307A4B81